MTEVRTEYPLEDSRQATLAQNDRLAIVQPKPIGRWVLSAALVLAVAWAVYKVAVNDAIAWHVVGEYLFNPTVMMGAAKTAFITIAVGAIGIPLGLLTALAALSKNPMLRAIARTYVWLFRGVPVLVQLIFWFNLGLLIDKVEIVVPVLDWVIFTEQTNTLITPLTAVLLGLGINEGAYMGEIMRGAILSVPKGQAEAAVSLGISPVRHFLYITLPQAIRIAIPAMSNQLIIMLKLSALASVITYGELLHTVQNIYSVNLRTIELLIVASFWYVVLTTFCTWLQGYLERRYSRSSRPVGK